jgi:hypothetical protein
MVPHIKKIFTIKRGKNEIEVEKKTARAANTNKAGKPYNNSENARPSIYVNGETGEATNISCILYSSL